MAIEPARKELLTETVQEERFYEVNGNRFMVHPDQGLVTETQPSAADTELNDTIKIGFGPAKGRPDKQNFCFLEKSTLVAIETDPEKDPVIDEQTTKDSWQMWNILLQDKLAAKGFIKLLKEYHGL